MERLKAELVATKARYDALIRIQPEAVCRWLPDTTLTFINADYAKICGMNPVSLVGRKWIELVPENDEREKVLGLVTSRGSQSQVISYEHRLLGRDGNTTSLRWTTYPIKGNQGRVTEFHSTGVRLTQEARIARDLRESEQRFFDLADIAPVGVYMLDDTSPIYVNQRFAEMHGYTPKELLKKDTLKDLTHPDDLAKSARRHRRRLLAGPGFEENFCFRALTKTGEIMYLERYSKVTTYGGRPIIVGIAIDVTQQKNDEAELLDYRNHLERRVKEKTLELRKSNSQLREDVKRRKKIEKDLEIQSKHLQELNTTLKVMLEQRDNDKKEFEERILLNVKNMVLPHLRLLKKTRLDPTQQMLAYTTEANLGEIIAPFMTSISRFGFTPTETLIISLIKQGNTSKQIAQALSVCRDAVSRHRYNIRRKLGLNKRVSNLQSYLNALQ